MLIWQQSGELQVDLDLLTQLRQNHLIWWRRRRSRQLDGAAALSWEIDLCESPLVRSPPPLNLDCIMISYTGAGSAQELTRPWSSFSAWGQWWLYARLWFRPELKRIEKVWDRASLDLGGVSTYLCSLYVVNHDVWLKYATGQSQLFQICSSWIELTQGKIK